MEIPKVVVDTNVFVSAAILKGQSSILMEKWKEGKFILCFSPDIFDEYFEVISRTKFKQEEKDIRELAEMLTERGIAIEPNVHLDIVKEDPDDNKFLECAVIAGADFIVSGDSHLLKFRKYQGIEILKISEFLHKI